LGKSLSVKQYESGKTLFNSIKRSWAANYNEVPEETKLVPINVSGGENGDARVESSGKKYSAQEISAMILTKLKESG